MSGIHKTFENSKPLKAIGAQQAQINADQASSGFSYPSDYFDQWLAEIYCPEHLPAILDQFGCPNGNNGEIMNCHNKIDRYLTASIFACNTRKSLNSPTLKEKFESGEIGPIFPMEFRLG